MTFNFTHNFSKKIDLDFQRNLALRRFAVCAPVSGCSLACPFLVELVSLVLNNFSVCIKRDIVLFVTNVATSNNI